MIFAFNEITVDTDKFRLSVAGKPISVEPQVFDVLVYLIKNRDRVVSRDELLENLWAGKVVTDAALGARLKDARKAVGDSGEKQQVIKTFHGRGYQFIAELSDSGSDVKSSRRRVTLAGQSLELPDTPSIAVLPFMNMSGDPEQEHFADGITDEIITGLSRVPGLFVVANNSTMVYKGHAVDVKDVGQDLGVQYVLEGGIRKAGNQIRITAQLVDAVTGLHLWAERYQRELDDIFSVQDEISHNVIVELQIKLVTGERSRPWATGTDNVAAWELVSQAKYLLESHVRDKAMQAREMAYKALELDRNYSVAWTMLGWTFWEEAVWEWGSDPEKSMQEAFDAAQESLKDPQYPGSYALLSHILLSRGDKEKAIEMCRKASQLAPSDAGILALLGNIYVDLGYLEEGIQNLQRAIRLSPYPPAWYLSVLGAGIHLNGDNEVAIPILKQALDREPESV